MIVKICPSLKWASQWSFWWSWKWDLKRLCQSKWHLFSYLEWPCHFDCLAFWKIQRNMLVKRKYLYGELTIWRSDEIIIQWCGRMMINVSSTKPRLKDSTGLVDFARNLSTWWHQSLFETIMTRVMKIFFMLSNHSQAFFQCSMCASKKTMLEKLHSPLVLLRTEFCCHYVLYVLWKALE